MEDVRVYVVDGKEYLTLAELAREAGISYVAAYARMRRGWSDEEIFKGKKKKECIKEPEKRQRKHLITVGGVEYLNRKEAYKVLKPSASYNTVKQRLVSGWPPEEAFELSDRLRSRSEDVVRKNRQSDAVEFEGVLYANYQEVAKAVGMEDYVVYNRLYRYGWSVEEALTTPVLTSVDFKGKSYRSYRSLWEECAITDYNVFLRRKREGMSLEVCLGLEEPCSKYDFPDGVEIQGNLYYRLSEVSERFDISVNVLKSRLRTMSIIDAVNKRPTPVGRYTEASLLRDEKLCETDSTLYFVVVTVSGVTLHKIGITTKGVKERLKGYEYQIVAQYFGRLLDAFYVEQIILDEFSDYIFKADVSFSGRTETMELNSFEVENISQRLEELSNDFSLERRINFE